MKLPRSSRASKKTSEEKVSLDKKSGEKMKSKILDKGQHSVSVKTINNYQTSMLLFRQPTVKSPEKDALKDVREEPKKIKEQKFDSKSQRSVTGISDHIPIAKFFNLKNKFRQLTL
jgi:hypothetical protein